MPAWLSHQGPDADVVVSTRIRLGRNLAHHQFPCHASLFERSLIFSEATDAVQQTAGCKSFNSVNFVNVDKKDRMFLVEERFATNELDNFDGDRGLVHDASHRVSVMVNEEDHIRFLGIDAGLCTADLWTELDAIDDSVGMQVEYAFNGSNGFLTSNPVKAGSGLHASCLVHLPGLVLTHAIDAVLQGASQLGLSARGFYGENASVIGSLFLLSKSCALGSTESAFCAGFADVIRSIADHERKARARLLTDARTELTDKIYRSYGILTNAELLSVDEALTLLSALRLGIECTLFDKCTIVDLNRLMLFVFPAHCAAVTKKDLDEVSLRAARAGLAKAFFNK